MRLLTLVALVVVTACKEPPPPSPPPEPPPPKPVEKKDPDAEVKILDDERTCTVDDECTLITVDCCNCNTLGMQTGVRKDRVLAVAKRREPICLNAYCPQAISNDPSCNAQRARCINGMCTPDAPGVAAPQGVGVERIQ